MATFEKYSVGDSVVAISARNTRVTEEIKPPPYIFDPMVDGYLAWLCLSESDFLALIRWRLIVKGRRNDCGASTEPQNFIKHLMTATSSPSVTVLAKRLDANLDTLKKSITINKNSELHDFLHQLMQTTSSPSVEAMADRFGLDPEQLKKEMEPSKIRWLPTHTLRTLIAKASVDQRTKQGNSLMPPETAENVRKFSLLTTAETGSMIRVLDQDELYAGIGRSWRKRFHERQDLEPPTIADIPWLLKKARNLSTTLWNDHTLFQQLCLEEIALKKGLPDWRGCRAHMHSV